MAIESVGYFDALPEGRIANISSRSVYPPPLLRPDQDQPLLIDEGRKSFSLHKRSRKKCYMLSARSLHIAWGNTPTYWRWISLPEARFGQVAELIAVCWLDISGKIDVSMLSPSTLYTANLVFKSTGDASGFSGQAGKGEVGLAGEEKFTCTVSLDHTEREVRGNGERHNDHNYPKERGDGWMETRLGDYFYDGGQEGELKMRFLDPTGNWKHGIIIQGIEIIPKQGNKSHSASALIVQGNDLSRLSRRSSNAPSFFCDDIKD